MRIIWLKDTTLWMEAGFTRYWGTVGKGEDDEVVSITKPRGIFFKKVDMDIGYMMLYNVPTNAFEIIDEDTMNPVLTFWDKLAMFLTGDIPNKYA